MAHPHQILFDPSGGHVFVPDLGTNLVHSYAWEDGALTEASGLGEGSSRTPRRNSLSVRGSMRREASTRAAYDEDANSGSDFSDAAERVSPETSKPGDD